MVSQKSLTSVSQLPEKWRPKYILKRIGEENITLSLETRDEILRQLASSGRFVQIGEFTVMLNSIKSIDPYWGKNNIPPRPKEEPTYLPKPDGSGFITAIANQEEIDEWHKYFGERLTERWLEK